MFGYSWGPILIIMVIVLLLFGPKRLPELGESIGKAIKSFKAAHDDQDTVTYTQAASNPGAASETPKPTCPQCHKELGGDFAFCPHCGQNMKSA